MLAFPPGSTISLTVSKPFKEPSTSATFSSPSAPALHIRYLVQKIDDKETKIKQKEESHRRQ